ncbi:MAG: hypothetical protein JOZ39_08945 [Chloroflexi bacterium]|nr:hypothetical protein [Chloroflexota bacterium]
MPRPSTVSEAGEEAARKLLEGVDPASLESAEVLAGIDSLSSQKSVAAADALARIHAPKDLAKAARRALFRLQSAGIRPTEQPVQTAQPDERVVAPKITLLEGFVSSYDPRGTRAVAILAEKPFTGLISLFAIASDTDGLVDAELTSTNKKAFRTRLENFSRQYAFIEFVDVPAEYANQIVHRTARLNEASGQVLPQDFSMWRTFGAEAPDPELRAPIYSELDAEKIGKDLDLTETSELATTEFEAWLYEEERLKEYLVRLDTAKGGPLVLSADAQKSRETTVVDEAADAIFQDDELQRARERLEETAHYLLRKGDREAAERCLRAALAVGEGQPHQHPFLRELVARSIAAAGGEADHEHAHEHHHEHDHPHAARTESGIIIPT